MLIPEAAEVVRNPAAAAVRSRLRAAPAVVRNPLEAEAVDSCSREVGDNYSCSACRQAADNKLLLATARSGR